MEKRSETILKIAAEMEAVIKQNSVAAPDENAQGRLRFLANQLSGVDSYAAEKAFWLVSCANKFYSARKHMKHPGGAPALWAEMASMIRNMRNQAEVRANTGD